MTSKTTLTNQWLGRASSDTPVVSDRSANALAFHNLEAARFNPKKFLVPGWRGKSLASSAGRVIQKVLSNIQKDVSEQLLSSPNFNLSLKQAIYDEFLHYADWATLHFNGLEQVKSFWTHLQSQQSPHREHLDRFIQVYCVRVATIYFLKTRFLNTLCFSGGRKLKKVDLLNPNSLITQFFKRSSSTQLPCDSLKANQYSWYRPAHHLVNELFELLERTQEIELSELLKVMSIHLQAQSAEGKYSHTLSNQNFGKFLNHLLLELPAWTSEQEDKKKASQSSCEPITCKVTGDFLASIACAVWNESDSSQNLDGEIVYPIFYTDEFHYSQFFKHCSELQYLTLIAHKATQLNISAVQFLCHLVNKAQGKLVSQNSAGQISMFSELNFVPEPRYDRIVLNLNEFPKNNPHFYLINKITSQLKYLNDKGHLVLLSTKKLFVPSQSEKVEQLLKKIKLEACLTLNHLKGRGELGPYVYIFSKNKSSDVHLQHQAFLGTSPASLNLMKHPCFNFRIRGELNSFHQFHTVLEELSQFLRTKSKDSTPIFQKELSNGIIFEFFKDAIVDGRLINSTSKDPSSITHPNFFKNLMNSSVPFGHFFNTESLTSREIFRPNTRFSPDWLGVSLKNSSNYCAVLVVDMRSADLVRVELIDVDAYKAKSEEYGFALCSYFGLVPKVKEININLFREFFISDIGLQIIQLCLSGGPQKLKSKLQSLLMPKFFIRPEVFPEQVQPHFEFFSSPIEKLLSLTAEEFLNNYKQSEQSVEKLFHQYPWRTLSVLSHFKNNLQLCLAKLENGNNSVLSQFNNPQVIQKLRQLKCQKIYPNNTDFYVEFNLQNTQDLYQPLKDVQLKSDRQGEQTNTFVELSNDQKTLVRVFSDQALLKFMQYILKNAEGMPIAHILQNLSLPSLEDFKQVLDEGEDISKAFSEVLNSCQNIMTKYIRNQIHLSHGPQ